MASLSPLQDQVLALIASGSTAAAAARQAGVHRHTIANWLKSQEFRQNLDWARTQKRKIYADEAEALAGLELYVPRAVLPAPQEDEFYFADLIGLAAQDEAGETIGHVVHVLNYGAGDMLEIAPRSGGETMLVPFSKAAVPVVDINSGRVVVRLPDEIEAAPISIEEEPAAG